MGSNIQVDEYNYSNMFPMPCSLLLGLCDSNVVCCRCHVCSMCCVLIFDMVSSPGGKSWMFALNACCVVYRLGLERNENGWRFQLFTI